MNMNYFIDPSVFYWINVLAGAQTLLGILGGITLVGGVSFIIGAIYNKYQIIYWGEEKNSDNKKYLKTCTHGAKICMTIGILLTLGCVFLPDKGTSMQMLVAKTATFDNLNWTVAQVKEVIDYIVTAIKSI